MINKGGTDPFRFYEPTPHQPVYLVVQILTMQHPQLQGYNYTVQISDY